MRALVFLLLVSCMSAPKPKLIKYRVGIGTAIFKKDISSKQRIKYMESKCSKNYRQISFEPVFSSSSRKIATEQVEYKLTYKCFTHDKWWLVK